MFKKVLIIIPLLTVSCVEPNYYEPCNYVGENYNNQDAVYLAEYYLNKTGKDCREVREIAYIAANSEIESPIYYRLIELSILSCFTWETVKMAENFDLGRLDRKFMLNKIEELKNNRDFESIEEAITYYNRGA